MATKTSRPPTRTRPRHSRTGALPSTGAWRGRRQPQKSTARKALDAVTGALPGIGRSSSSTKRRGSSAKGRARGGKAGGFAMVSAAAGLAYRNRSKLMSMLSRKGSRDHAPDETAPVEAGTRATAGPVDPVRSGNLAPTDPGNRPDMR